MSPKAVLCWLSLLSVLAGSLIWIRPMAAMAHGWKAPADAAEKKNPVPSDSSSIERGRELFLQNCAGCHGVGARGDGPVGKMLGTKPPNLVERAKHHSPGDFFWKISTGKSPMPGYGKQMTEQQIWDIVNFIRSLK